MTDFRKHSYAKGPLVGLLLLLCFSVNAQQVRFKAPVKQSIRTFQVMEQDSGFYITVGQFFDATINRYRVNFIKLDSNGSVVKQRSISDSAGTIYPTPHVSLEKTFNDNYFTPVSQAVSGSRKNSLLFFNSNLDTLHSYVPFQDSSIRFFSQAKQVPDSGFVITGYWYDQPKNMYHANLVRTDKNGQLLWEKVIKRPDSISLEPYQVYSAPDGGFLLAGQRAYLPEFLKTADPLLIRTDSAGNLLWKQTYGGPLVDGIAAAAYRDDGDIMLFYSQGTRPIQQGHSLMPTFSIVDDQTGQELQKKTYPFIDYRDLSSYNLLKDGDKYIGVGEFTQETTILQGGGYQSYTLCINQNLDDVWFRNYNAQDSLARPDESSILYDLRPTSDGGYIAGGYISIYDTTHLDVNLGFNGWIVKMDSMGCVEQSCVNRIGVEEQVLEEEKAWLVVYPNPSSNVFHLQLNSDLDATVTLYDLKGQKLQETLVISGTGRLSPSESLPAGIYLIHLKDEKGRFYSKKVFITD